MKKKSNIKLKDHSSKTQFWAIIGTNWIRQL